MIRQALVEAMAEVSVVIRVALYYDVPSLNPPKVYTFCSVKIACTKWKLTEKRLGMAHLRKNRQTVDL